MLPVLLSALFPVYFHSTGTIMTANSTIACGPKQPLLIKESLGFILSPSFDNFHFYPPNSKCSWTIEAPAGKVIVLKTMSFGMNIDCSEDSVEIYEGVPPYGRKVGKYCGYYVPARFRSSTNVLHMKFRSGPVPKYTGFQFYFEHTDAPVKCTSEQVRCRHGSACVDPEKKCDGVDDCGDGTDEQACESADLSAKCGVPKIPPITGNERIVGGRDAIPGSWPWQVSLRDIDLAPFGHQCGGMLINKQWVLTAGHCFRRKLDTRLWNVLLGKYYKLIPDKTEQLRYIESIHIHPGYKGLNAKFSTPWLEKKQHDIALVKLNAPVTLTDYVMPVCLPKSTDKLAPGSTCHVTGWGDTYGTGYDFVLKQAVVPIISRETCRKMHFLFPIAETMVCAGYKSGGHDSCQGDSGGPLVIYDETAEKWVAYGVVSTGGSICAEKESPGIYTSIPSYVDWISNVTGLNYGE